MASQSNRLVVGRLGGGQLKDNITQSWKTTASGVVPGVILLLQEAQKFLSDQPVDFNVVVMAISIITGFSLAKEK